MARTVLYLVSDEPQVIERMKALAQIQGLTLECYSNSQWQNCMNDPAFRSSLAEHSGTLVMGSQGADQGAKILQFPMGGTSGSSSPSTVSRGAGVKTINEMESMAIENAIVQFNGNLTEAAKALGIGRATLYRKVKQYQIDPNQARRRRAA